ncbi:F-box/FBD/LRR-repeat protein At1g13570-like [Nicotiana tabacum]|uniref:F-box/FBD/LRR-repeat protein At1g13570-like n=2 Tax=Nicotiana TaxID=4085 RepID=A0A1S4B632_TOBAC|nr:PREDICTED: F-box/FBD/LRR-repeat protein At1g13570-like [Nicotiana sylvestris]XP_009776582.1 PREDICTED: F-box/FBD/LRR-repeat protein At1g13570-like [Nicotiana sylvestris]XP_009776583.1 PREDICTED: F-box/FBD/LRR-repeat protein At1g13570-like [Nicotiana sylvestris]XP_009776584.1 PREDICTED: F-box/FBD/LRR-repeat protein At1g13570-like [Nicotiana sylvestris]XP_009776585.1 PREDICTED: F-box/FBD/LRR-repeat protein At1g13570-like [Nicotiana sylvestris]XP_016484323.1 PREDICTED: F-box/FBD/LRR-repeat pro
MLEKVTVSINSRVLPDPPPGCSNFTKFFNYMPSLQELDLRGSVLEYLILGGLPKSPPTALNNVKSLSISSISFRNVEEVTCAVYLIKSCRKLEQLTIECESVDNIVEPVVQFLQAQSSSYGALKLQRVHMNMFIGVEMEMEFVKFILASAPILEEIFIWNFAYLLPRPGAQIMDEIKQFSRASPNVEEVEVEDCVRIEALEAMEVRDFDY